MDDRPIRCWIHPTLISELKEWRELIDGVSLEQTGYKISRLDNMPLSSNMCAIILSKLRKSLDKNNFKVKKEKNPNRLNIKLLFNEKELDNNNLNIEIQKIQGLKKNEITFI